MPPCVVTGFFCHQILPGLGHDFNRRILKTVCPVVWEGAGAQSPVPDPIFEQQASQDRPKRFILL
jgi:hypothetical protein